MADTEKLIKTPELPPENYSALASSEPGQPEESAEVDQDLHTKRTWWRRLFIYNPLSYYLPRRYGIATLAFLGFCNVYSLRVNLSVAIVAMTTDKLSSGRADFSWDRETQGLILSSFFYGYIVTQIPGGWLANKLGGKRVFGYGIFLSSILCLITPLATTYGGVPALMVVRILQGLAEGVVYPSIHAVWSKWSPIHERSRLATIAFSGSYVGTVIALPVSGILSDFYGWQSIFYVFGVIAMLWTFFWMKTVGETPAEDKRISEDEIDYIASSIGPPSPAVCRRRQHLPWGKMLTSPPVWAISIAHFSENWGFYTLLTLLPKFMNDMYQMQMSQAGLLSALPYMLMAIVVQIAGFLADYLRVHYFSTTVVRKLFTCGAFICQTLFMLCAAYVGTPGLAIGCLTMAVGLGGFAWAGFSVNHLDIAPQYASVLMGISNTFATIPGMVSPTLAGKMLHDGTITEWKGIFSVSATIYLVGATLYGILASGEQQKWAGSSVADIGSSAIDESD